MRWIDRLSDLFAQLSAWMFFAVGGMITYEVLARYLFNAPTFWAEEMSQFFQIWATYLAAAHVLRHRNLITIEFLLLRLGNGWRKAADLFSLLVIAGFSAIAVVFGIDIVAESVEQGRHTATMMAVPNWMTETAIPLGFAIMFAQCVVEIVRVIQRDAPPTEGANPLGGH